jgi:hypothetical protein
MTSGNDHATVRNPRVRRSGRRSPPAFLPFLPQRADPERGVRPLVTNGYLEVAVAAEIIQAKLHPLSS